MRVEQRNRWIVRVFGFLFGSLVGLGCGSQLAPEDGDVGAHEESPMGIAPLRYAKASGKQKKGKRSATAQNSNRSGSNSTAATTSASGNGSRQAQKSAVNDHKSGAGSSNDTQKKKQKELDELRETAKDKIREANTMMQDKSQVPAVWYFATNYATRARKGIGKAYKESQQGTPDWDAVETFLKNALRDATRTINDLKKGDPRITQWSEGKNKLEDAEKAVQAYRTAAGGNKAP